MNHSDIRSRMASYLDGELSLEARALFDAHLDQCDECTRDLSEMRETIRLLRSLPTPEPPPGFVAGVMRRIEAGEGQASWLGSMLDSVGQWVVPRFVIPATAVAAALVLTVVSGNLDLRRLDLRPRVAQPEIAGIAAESVRTPTRSIDVPSPPRGAQVRTVVDRAGDERVELAIDSQASRLRPVNGTGLPISRFNPESFGPIRRDPRDEEAPFFVSQQQQIGPYISMGASAAPPIDVELKLRSQPRITPVAVSRRGFSPLMGNEEASAEARRNQQLDARLNFLVRDPTGYAQQQASVSLAERELWMAEVAKRAEERGEVERVTAALEGSGETQSMELLREFEAAVEKSDSTVASAAAQATPE